MSVGSDYGYCGAAISVAPYNSSDNCGVRSTIASASNPAYFVVGTTIVSFSVSDATNRMASCSVPVTVRDVEPPVLGNVDLFHCSHFL